MREGGRCSDEVVMKRAIEWNDTRDNNGVWFDDEFEYGSNDLYW